MKKKRNKKNHRSSSTWGFLLWLVVKIGVMVIFGGMAHFIQINVIIS